MDRLSSNLEAIAEKLRLKLSAKHGARERGLQLSRETIRHCANAIRATHRGEYNEARELIYKARTLLSQMGEALGEHSDLSYAGFVHDAQKEYAEATITLAVVAGDSLPDPDELGIGYAAYLNGLGEAVGELRRHLLDVLRQDEVSGCEELLRIMDDVYSVLVTIDFPDAITGGLKRTTDMVRGVLEKTRGDLTMALRQRDLEIRLGNLDEKLKKKAEESADSA